MERLVQANSWPYAIAQFSTSNPDGTPHVYMDIANKGVGPARVETLQVIYKGAPMAGPRVLLNAILHRTTTAGDAAILTSSIVHMVMAAREQIPFVDFPAGQYRLEEYSAIAVAMNYIDMVTCYCSVFDDCWESDTRKPRAIPVDTCPEPRIPFK